MVKLCDVSGCWKSHHAHGFCQAHYYQWRMGRNPLAPAPKPVDGPGWTPPKELSPAWKARNTYRPPEARRDRSCALSACGGTAVQGSQLCSAHKAYSDAQERLKARGLA